MLCRERKHGGESLFFLVSSFAFRSRFSLEWSCILSLPLICSNKVDTLSNRIGNTPFYNDDNNNKPANSSSIWVERQNFPASSLSILLLLQPSKQNIGIYKIMLVLTFFIAEEKYVQILLHSVCMFGSFRNYTKVFLITAAKTFLNSSVFIVVTDMDYLKKTNLFVILETIFFPNCLPSFL